MKDSMGKFSLDTLASCAFGVDGQSFEDKESVFVNNASRIFQTSKMDQFKIFGAMLIPGMAKMIRQSYICRLFFNSTERMVVWTEFVFK